MVAKYKTLTDYPNESGINQLAYPLRDAITIVNPYFFMLFVIMVILTVASYYTYVAFTGRTRFFNSLMASSFVTFVMSVFLAAAEWINPYTPVFFIGVTVIAYILSLIYRD